MKNGVKLLIMVWILFCFFILNGCASMDLFKIQTTKQDMGAFEVTSNRMLIASGRGSMAPKMYITYTYSEDMGTPRLALQFSRLIESQLVRSSTESTGKVEFQSVEGYLQLKSENISRSSVYGDILETFSIPVDEVQLGRIFFIERKLEIFVLSKELYKNMNQITISKNDLVKIVGHIKRFYYECVGKELDIPIISSQQIELAESHYNRGKELYDNKGYEAAILEFNESIRINPYYDLAYFYRGNSYFLINNYNQAIIEFTESIKIHPLREDTYYNIGISYERLQDTPKAIEYYNKALQINPNHKEAKSGLNRLSGQ